MLWSTDMVTWSDLNFPWSFFFLLSCFFIVSMEVLKKHGFYKAVDKATLFFSVCDSHEPSKPWKLLSFFNYFLFKQEFINTQVCFQCVSTQNGNWCMYLYIKKKKDFTFQICNSKSCSRHHLYSSFIFIVYIHPS